MPQQPYPTKNKFIRTVQPACTCGWAGPNFIGPAADDNAAVSWAEHNRAAHRAPKTED